MRPAGENPPLQWAVQLRQRAPSIAGYQPTGLIGMNGCPWAVMAWRTSWWRGACSDGGYSEAQWRGSCFDCLLVSRLVCAEISPDNTLSTDRGAAGLGLASFGCHSTPIDFQTKLSNLLARGSSFRALQAPWLPIAHSSLVWPPERDSFNQLLFKATLAF